VSFSLHSIAEIESYFHQDGMNWIVQTYLLRNPRWDREEATQRSVSHSLILAQKAPVTLPIPFQLQGTLLEEEYQILKAESDKVITFVHLCLFTFVIISFRFVTIISSRKLQFKLSCSHWTLPWNCFKTFSMTNSVKPLLPQHQLQQNRHRIHNKVLMT
jgi:hypothetical protein